VTAERGISDRYYAEIDGIRLVVEELRNEQVIPWPRLVRQARHLYREAWRREVFRYRETDAH
jgi:hypothetical protein